jgi:hypothetical protein
MIGLSSPELPAFEQVEDEGTKVEARFQTVASS